MGWTNAVPKAAPSSFARPAFERAKIDWAHLVVLDYETYFDTDYTLKKLSTSEYVRDARFKEHMVGVKVGKKKTQVIPTAKIPAFLKTINWKTHDLLCHNCAFDGFILSHHHRVVPRFYYDTLSMARGLHSNDIGAGLDEVAQFYGVGNKIPDVLDQMKGVWPLPKELYTRSAEYCAMDVELTLLVFEKMLENYPVSELKLIDMTVRMFCDPVLKVDIPRVEKELAREVKRREDLMATVVDVDPYPVKELLKTTKERALEGVERHTLMVKRVIGSNERFAELLRAEGVEPPVKISPAWMKKPAAERDDADKWSYAFAKDDADFTELPDRIEELGADLNLNDQKDVARLVARQDRLRELIDCRLAVKSTTNLTRAERFLTAGANGWSLPVGYAYYRAHTGRWGGNNKMNMQNLTRGGELRLSILAPKGMVLVVGDSGQIECRVNGWLWGQDDLMDAFRAADAGTGRDAYCNFGDHVYGRVITKDDKMERFVGKVCIAEDELVLTDRGLVPINLLSKVDRLWDGVEWVTHAGIIDQGIKEVITHDGLTATPDHEVFTEDGRIIPLRQAASEMARLQTTGAEGAGIRFCDNHVIADTPRKRLSVRIGEMCPDWYYETDPPLQPAERENNVVPEERTTAGAARRDPGQAVRRDHSPLQRPRQQAVGEVRSARDQMPVQRPDGIHSVGRVESPSCGLQGGGDRPRGQQWQLRAWEPAVGNQETTGGEPMQHRLGANAGRGSAARGVEQSVQLHRDGADGEGRDDLGTDSCPSLGGGSGEAEELAFHTRKVRVYDIANAGPRRRFTVSGKLVLNCVLGLGFQMGAPKFQITLAKGALGGPPVYFDLDRCKTIVNTYRRKNFKIVAGWAKCVEIIEDMAAGRTGSYKCLSWEKEKIWLPNGMCLKYPDLKKKVGDKGWDEWSYQADKIRKKIYGGLLCENIVQALARIVVAEQLLMVAPKRRVVMITHDEGVLAVAKRSAEAAFRELIKAMRTPLPWCPDLPLNSEGGYAENYSK